MTRPKGRPRLYDDRVQSSFRCPPDLLAAGQAAAAQADVSFNLWLERAMRRYLTVGGTAPPEETTEPPWSWQEGPAPKSQ
jgi:hypothetical protein